MMLHVVCSSDQGISNSRSTVATRGKGFPSDGRNFVFGCMLAVVIDLIDSRFRDGLTRLISHDCSPSLLVAILAAVFKYAAMKK
jgi:hypothetical protein